MAGLLSMLKNKLSPRNSDTPGRSGGGLSDILMGAAKGYVSGSKSDTSEGGLAAGAIDGLGVGQAAADRRRIASGRIRIPKKLFGLNEEGDMEFENGKEAAAALLGIRQRDDAAEAKTESAEMRKLLFDERQADRASRDLEARTQRFSKELQGTGIPDATDTLQNIFSLLPEPGENIPGFGATRSLPALMLSKNGKDLRQAVGKLMNLTIKDRSGTAVSVPEFERFKQEFGTGVFNTDEQLRTGLANALSGIQNISTNIYAGYGDDVKSKYAEQGGRNYFELLGGIKKQKQGSGPRSFKSVEEAEASGYKGEAIVGGRKAVIE